jgi:large subunit ribosomal protein L17
MLRNLACSLILTERDPEYFEGLFQADGKTPVKPPAVQGRVVTTLHKAKEVRPLVEKCISIAKEAVPHDEKANEFMTTAARNSEEWHRWRKSDQWRKWSAARAPGVAARRRVFSMLRQKAAVQILFNDIAPRFVDRQGGYTRIMRLANTRLGDAGTQAVLEFVGKHDRVKQISARPAFVDDSAETE